ncbi:HTH-type transcriptional regulator CynR [Pseudovibrio sp. W74]|uniref:LysR family transcriptional regulator n=3 Tax=unclassified Pseudovibrio TaxID=2627060 RepID=UPI0007AEC4A4|nr:LysR family transcriptional regulator [Pseudovibrio sp. W74]KZL02618.1 HTH-type transcriptional regulator CynR [Pseudovibrio sp. W74]
MQIKIEMLRCFVAVARTGNLSDAAEVLGRTPSALSMMLKQLEENLGQSLFETDRKNRLSALGSFVLEQAERELYQFDGMVQDIVNFAKAKSGKVRLAAVPSVASTIMPEVIARFLSMRPDVHIELRDMDSASILRELEKDRIDLGIASTQGHATSFHTQTLFSDRFGILCHRSSGLLQKGQGLNWEDLREERLIANNLSQSIQVPACQRLHAEAGLKVHNITSLIAMVRSQIGITILPDTTTQMLNTDEINFIPLPDTSIQREIQIIRKSETPPSPAAQALEQTILTFVQDNK